jgi:methanol---5-hydroxybenzimidazolylcobamide Co-methyltransferase
MPEINYILPHGSEVSENTLDKVVALYRTMAEDCLERAVELGVPTLVIEIELVFELTVNPEWGERVIRATREAIEAYTVKGVHAALRTTVADIRDRVRPPKNRSSAETELMFESIERCAPYSDILSVESTGGKEVSDQALLQCDAGGVAFALSQLASNDMAFVWPRIVDICKKHGKVAGGDAACGFSNTAMQLAHKRMIPTVFAAVVRAMGAARSLVAIECGATGPDKDCAYEGPILKAITGIPIAMEGKSAACAHSSPLGNVAMCCCDLWSNESVPYVNLFGGHTPAVCLEQLWYDCKMMNTATERGFALPLRDILSESDIHTSAEALILAPTSALRIARAIVSSPDYGQRTLNAAREALAIIEEALAQKQLSIPAMEIPWVDTMKNSLDEFGNLNGTAIDHYSAHFPDSFIPAEYGL